MAPLERVAADMLQVTISPVSRLHGVEVGELRLPAGSSVSMVVRDGQAIVPERRTVLRRGDDLLVVTPRGLREPTVQRLRTVSAHGRLGRWLDEPLSRARQAGWSGGRRRADRAPTAVTLIDDLPSTSLSNPAPDHHGHAGPAVVLGQDVGLRPEPAERPA